jgi:hypothetical protein
MCLVEYEALCKREADQNDLLPAHSPEMNWKVHFFSVKVTPLTKKPMYHSSKLTNWLKYVITQCVRKE